MTLDAVCQENSLEWTAVFAHNREEKTNGWLLALLFFKIDADFILFHSENNFSQE